MLLASRVSHLLLAGASFRSASRTLRVSRMAPNVMALAQPSPSSGRGPYRAPINAAAAYASGGSDETPAPAASSGMSPETWDKITERLVGVSAAPFSIIAMPQVIQNFAAISGGNPAALGIISWEGITSGTFGNTLMSTHFASRGEASALNVQLISIVNNFLILSQVAYTGYMPKPVFAAVAGAAVLAATANVSRAKGWLPKGSDDAWRIFQLSSGIIGLSIMPQVMYSVLYPGSPSLAPAGIAFMAVCAWLYSKKKSSASRDFNSLIDSLPGTSATLLFGLSPLPQLIKNFIDPSTLGGLSLGTLVLAIVGNSLMFPRALKTKDPIWLCGSVWANFAGWLTLLSLFLGKDALTGLSFVDGKVFAGITTVLLIWFSGVLVNDTRVKGNANVIANVAEVFSGPKKA